VDDRVSIRQTRAETERELPKVRVMSSSARPLLCELHAHTTWSDGALSVRELVDLYGRARFDVLAITDHVVRLDRPGSSISAESYNQYLDEVEAEGERAFACYKLIVVPGLELTYDDPDPRLAAHALAIGLRRFIGVEAGLDHALEEARDAGACLIAAHPYTLAAVEGSPRTTARFSEEPDWARDVVHRFELCNRHDFFDWVAQARLPAVANGDFHRPEHLATWKTTFAAARHEEAVVAYLRSRDPVSLIPCERAVETVRRAA
jgi:predicted metal-dependent phosphoesterase TrpH